MARCAMVEGYRGHEVIPVVSGCARTPDRIPERSVLCVLDDFSRECLATVVGNSPSGERVGRELESIALGTG